MEADTVPTVCPCGRLHVPALRAHLPARSQGSKGPVSFDGTTEASITHHRSDATIMRSSARNIVIITGQVSLVVPRMQSSKSVYVGYQIRNHYILGLA